MRAKRAAFESGNNRIYELLVDNLIVLIYVLHNDFGFGEKRLDSYINAVMDAAKQFDEYARDGVLDFKTVAERVRYRDKFKEYLRIMCKDFVSDELYNAIFVDRTPTTAEVTCKAKRERDMFAVSVAEAAKMQTIAQAFGDFLKDKEIAKNANLKM